QAVVEMTPLLGQPCARSRVQIARLAQIRCARLVADDAHGDLALMQSPERIEHAFERLGIEDARAIDDALQQRPVVLAADRPQIVAHGDLVPRRIRRNPGAFERDLMKQRVVADQRVVEIQAKQHDQLKRLVMRATTSAVVRPISMRACVWPPHALRKRSGPATQTSLRRSTPRVLPHSSTALPAPPASACSSSTTTSFLSANVRSSSASSSGLTVCMLTTSAEHPCPSSASAACMATASILPTLRIATSRPARMVMPRPIANAGGVS